ncbi:MAG: ATPase [Bacteroidaceae bacterium]|nr:ATPase [Bacteroidaceae bacterium]
MSRVLIADAGATKTDWVLAEGGVMVENIKTQGISPIHQDEETIRRILDEELQPHLKGRPTEIYFYGAGCTPAKIPVLCGILQEAFGAEATEVYSDLMGAARALCGQEAGIACILGTGTNSCLYDGKDIVRNTPPLGYILGDEGSGAAMGRDFVADVLKGIMPADICEGFFRESGLTYPEIIDHVYRQPLAGRWLASLSRVVVGLREHPVVHDFLVRHFRRFIERNIIAYAHPEMPLNFVGGIAFSFRPELEAAAATEGMTIGKTLRSPMPGLLEFHAA